MQNTLMSIVRESTRLRVRVPASTSNLGAGFDCIGLALDRYLEVEYLPDAEPLRVVHRPQAPAGTGDDLLLGVLRSQLASRGVHTPTGLLNASSDIPVARGLGSSAAAVVAALILADRLAPVYRDDGTPHRLLAAAVPWEGHLDNVAPALLGGLVAMCEGSAGNAMPVRLQLSPDIGFAYAAPDHLVPTPHARAVLPATVPHAVAARALGRMTALVQGLAMGDPELLRTGFQDDLHVPFRLKLIPGAAQARSAATEAGAWAVTISGSGSGLIAACPPAKAAGVAEAMDAVFRARGGAGTGSAFVVVPDLSGARVESVEGACL